MSPVVKTRSIGFTLIELMVVVFIIGILVAATLTIIPKVQKAVRGAQTSAQLSALANAIQQYYNDFKSYPGPLPNNQLCAIYDKSVTPAISYSPYIIDPANPTTNSFPLTADTTTSFPNTDYVPTNTTLRVDYITGAQNLTLGLLGGLELKTATDATGNLVVSGFIYRPQNILSDGVTPAPKGASSLNFSSPRRSQPYIQVKAGDLSTPNIHYNGDQGASFVDNSGDLSSSHRRSPADAMIPIFLDKYSDPLPFLYFRTNVGGTAIVGYRNLSKLASSSSTLLDPTLAGPTAQVAQYDLLQNLSYTTSRMGTSGDGTNTNDTCHGLSDQGVTFSGNTNQLLISSSSPPTPPVDTIDYKNNSGIYFPTNVTGSGVTKGGCNALAYFKDPTLNSQNYDGVTGNTHLGVARQKDGFLLISAGPDRLYGTHDDLVFPGPLLPAQ